MCPSCYSMALTHPRWSRGLGQSQHIFHGFYLKSQTCFINRGEQRDKFCVADGNLYHNQQFFLQKLDSSILLLLILSKVNILNLFYCHIGNTWSILQFKCLSSSIYKNSNLKSVSSYTHTHIQTHTLTHAFFYLNIEIKNIL